MLEQFGYGSLRNQAGGLSSPLTSTSAGTDLLDYVLHVWAIPEVIDFPNKPLGVWTVAEFVDVLDDLLGVWTRS